MLITVAGSRWAGNAGFGCTWVRPLHLGVVVEAGGDVRVIVGVGHVGPEQELVDLGRGKDARGADQARRLTSSTEADWGGRSLGGPGGAGSAALRRWTPV